MDWESYTQIYYHYILSVDHMRILTLLAEQTLENFPHKLPEDIRTPLEADFGKMIDIFGKIQRGQITESSMEESSPLFHHVVSIVATLVKMGVEPTLGDLDFKTLVYSNELVIMFACVDAFMADSLRAICQICPSILCSNKKIDVTTILSRDGWEDLIDHLAEQYVFEFGWSSVAKRLEALKDRHGIVIHCSESDFELLEEAEQIRNIIVHNGGRASREYIAQTQQANLRVGELVPITSEYLYRVVSIMNRVVEELYIAISKKFFGIGDSEIKFVARYDHTTT